MAWLILIIAGVFEVAFVVSMKLSNGFKNVKFTILTVIISFFEFFLIVFSLKRNSSRYRLCCLDGNWSSGKRIDGNVFFSREKKQEEIILFKLYNYGSSGS